MEDAHQGRGIGSVLLEHLADAARQAGIDRFVAEVLPVNSGMLRVFADAGYQLQRAYADGVVHLEFPIAPTEQSVAVQYRREHATEAASPFLADKAAPGSASRRPRGLGESGLPRVCAAPSSARLPAEPASAPTRSELMLLGNDGAGRCL